MSNIDIDQALQRVANASQLGLLALAVFGYFYTVIPIYQKLLLDEDIAKKTIELDATEKRIETVDALLKSRETELSGMNKKLDELRANVVAARAGLGRAEAEAGKLRVDVDLQYAELLPRLVTDVKWITLQECKEAAATDHGFADCVDQRVLTTANLAPMHPADRKRLSRIVRGQSAALNQAYLTALEARRNAKVQDEALKKEAQAKCDLAKASDDYKDRMKKVTIDYQCSVA